VNRIPDLLRSACSTRMDKNLIHRATRDRSAREFSSDDVMICRRKGARNGYFEWFTLLELVFGVLS